MPVTYGRMHDVSLRRTAAACIALNVIGLPRAAFSGPEAKVCVDAAERGQVSRQDGKLRKAREEFIACARDECPRPVRRDCSQWAAEVDAALPSIVPIARRDGQELSGVRVLVDDELVEDRPSGRAVAVDPGPHTIRFELAGEKPIEIRTVIHEAEKNRIIGATFEPREPKPAETRPAAPAPLPAAAASSAAPPVPVGAWIAIGVAVVGVAGFTYFGLSGRSDLSNLRASCVDICSPSSVDDARRKLLVGDVFLGAGIIAAGVATWLILTRPRVSPKTAGLAWSF